MGFSVFGSANEGPIVNTNASQSVTGDYFIQTVPFIEITSTAPDFQSSSFVVDAETAKAQAQKNSGGLAALFPLTAFSASDITPISGGSNYAAAAEQQQKSSSLGILLLIGVAAFFLLRKAF